MLDVRVERTSQGAIDATAHHGTLALASFNDLVVLKDRVQKAVCTNATMPHSEILFNKFWSDGGNVFLPGLLSTALGFRSCP